MHYYTFNIGDYRRDTAHLSRIEHSIYRDLIDWYYLEERPIPLEIQVVIRRLRLVSQDETEALKNVLSDFFTMQEDGFHHVRIDADVTRYADKSEVNRANGKKGGRPKAAETKDVNQLGFDRLQVANRNESEINPNQEPITNNQEPRTKKQKSSKAPPPDGVSQSVWDDFIALRKQKKAPVTDAAIAGIQREADKAGWPIENALRECCMRGWAGFKADWVASNMQSSGGVNKQEALEARNRAVGEAWLKRQLELDGENNATY